MSKSENLSEDYKRVEQERENKIEEKRVEEENKELAYYFHVAKKGQIEGWKEEERYPNGQLKARPEPLRFDEHIYIARSQKEIDFIEGSSSFGIHCFRCESLQDAHIKATGAEVAKNNRKVEVTLDMRADGRNVVTAE